MKRFVALVALVAVLALPYPAAPARAAGAAPAISLEQAINIAKAAFPVPAECEQFISNYEEYNGTQTWSLTWRNKDGDKNFYVSVDATTGSIRNYWRYQPTPGPRGRLPKLSQEQAKAIADALIARLQPAEAKQVRYVEPPYQPGAGLPAYGDNRYAFSYERMVNGIPFPENSFSVHVNGDTGEIEAYGFSWSSAAFPPLTGLLDAAAANRAFSEKIGLKPIWWRPSPENGVGQPLRLVYTVDGSQRLIDALTGEIIETPIYYGGAEKRLNAAAPDGRGGLTPAEQLAVDELAKYITADAAEKIARQAVGIGGEYVRTSANLMQDWEFPENSKRWTMSFTANEGKDNQRWASADIDALTGAVLGFYLPYADELLRNNKEPLYTREQAMATAEAFIRTMDADKAAQVKYVAPTDKVDDKHAVDYTFQFVRLHDGIEFPANYFSVTVSAYDNKVYRYNLRWADLAFPATDGALSEAAAEEKALAAYPLKLTYQTVPKDGEQVIRPVYAFEPMSAYFDGFTADPLDYRGEPVKNYARPSFTDIAGHNYEPEIRILIDLGAIDGGATTYRPDDAVTTAEFLKILTCVAGDGPKPLPLADGPWYKAYIDAGRKREFVLAGETVDQGAAVTRAAAARYIVRALGLEYLGKLGGIYQLPSGDSKVTADRGYLALAWGLNILQPEGNTLKPQQKVTRGEAAALIVRMLRVER